MYLMNTLYLHAEWFVALLKAAHGEELEAVHRVAKVEPALLADAEGAGGHEGFAVDLREGRVPGRGVNKQLAVQ